MLSTSCTSAKRTRSSCTFVLLGQTVSTPLFPVPLAHTSMPSLGALVCLLPSACALRKHRPFAGSPVSNPGLAPPLRAAPVPPRPLRREAKKTPSATTHTAASSQSHSQPGFNLLPSGSKALPRSAQPPHGQKTPNHGASVLTSLEEEDRANPPPHTEGGSRFSGSPKS
ncbi:hypothetical protein WMY93_032654 [Mugilogobius chulae]|uniref:Uncharacterized protein n=1 Tax=Mugilogobius chulae TaxID=88201 RepID=A0AAW0MW55_9GOBI